MIDALYGKTNIKGKKSTLCIREATKMLERAKDANRFSDEIRLEIDSIDDDWS